MAILAIGLAGAAVGNALIPTTIMGISGAGIGWVVGTVVGSLLFAPHTKTQGPKLTDMKLSSGGYGGGIPQIWGTPRINGNVIWSSDLIETSHTEKSGGKGGPSVEYTTYTYSVNCAVGVCEGPIQGIRRIWANGKLIYDLSGAGGAVNTAIIQNSGINIYLGSESQTADPTMQAALGSGNVPAHRGMAYVVFEGLQLADFGNRHPKFDFEVGVGGLVYLGIEDYREIPWFSNDLTNWSTRGSDAQGQYLTHIAEWAITNGTDQFVVFTSSNDGLGRVYPRVTPNGLIWEQGPDNADALSYETGFLNQDETTNRFVYVGGKYIILPTPYYQYGAENSGQRAIISSTDGLHWALDGYWPNDYWVHANTQINDVIFSARLNKLIAIMFDPISANTPTHIYSAPANDPTNFSHIGLINDTDLGAAYSFNLCEFNGSLWTVYLKASTNNFWIASSVNGVSWTDRYQVPDPDGDGSTYIAYVLSDGAKLVLMYGGYYLGDLTGKLQSRTSADGDNWSGDHLIDEYDLSFLGRPTYDGHHFTWSDFYDGETISRLFFSTDGVNWDVTLTGEIAIDGFKYVQSADQSDMVNGTTPLSDVVTDVCERAGLSQIDLDVSQVTDILVAGYIRSEQMTARSALEPLLAAYNVDAFESDGQLKFIKKTQGYAGPVIYENELGADSKPGEATDLIKMIRAQELELPNEVVIKFIDRSLEYDINQQYARRQAGNSTGSITINVPIVMTASEAMELAQSILYRAWVSRDQYLFSTTQKFAAYEPSDIVFVPFGGEIRQVRLTKKEESGFAINWTGVAEDLLVYDQDINASSGGGNTPILIAPVANTDLMVFETPVLRDQDDYLQFTVVAGGLTSDRWSGGNLYMVSVDGTATSILLGALPSRAITGRLTSALTAVSDPIVNSWDYVNSFTVNIPWGTLESRTPAEVLSGLNTAVIQRNDGTVEVIGFQTATLTAPNTYELSGLLRRIRQNSSFSGGGIDSKFALLTPSTAMLVKMQLPDVGTEYEFSGPRFGTAIDDATHVEATLTGMSKKPLSPINPWATKDGSSNIVMHWTRRTRIGGSWPTGEGGPLGELTESYEIDIMDGATVLRTLTSTTASVSYLIADQITDFGSAQTSVEVNVYQMSDFIGRGYPMNTWMTTLTGVSVQQVNTTTTGAMS